MTFISKPKKNNSANGLIKNISENKLLHFIIPYSPIHLGEIKHGDYKDRTYNDK